MTSETELSSLPLTTDSLMFRVDSSLSSVTIVTGTACPKQVVGISTLVAKMLGSFVYPSGCSPSSGLEPGDDVYNTTARELTD